jgi:hypothetical protein
MNHLAHAAGLSRVPQEASAAVCFDSMAQKALAWNGRTLLMTLKANQYFLMHLPSISLALQWMTTVTVGHLQVIRHSTPKQIHINIDY